MKENQNMLSNLPNIETLANLPWEKIDPALTRTAKVVGIITGVLGILGVLLAIISKVVVPYFEVCLVSVQFAALALNVYYWRKNKLFLAIWPAQPNAFFQFAIAFVNGFISFSQPSYYMHFVAGLWIVAGFCWTGLFALSAREKHHYDRERHDNLWRMLETITVTLRAHNLTQDMLFHLHKHTDRQNDIAKARIGS